MAIIEQDKLRPNEPSGEHVSMRDELTEVGAASISIYQRQMALVHRTWAQLSLYSTLMIFFGVVLCLIRQGNKLAIGPAIWLLPLLGFLAFLCGNYRALSFAVDELHLMRSLAIAESGMDLRGAQPMVSRRLHFFICIAVVLVYSAAWLIL